jgi:hypothetical protein
MHIDRALIDFRRLPPRCHQATGPEQTLGPVTPKIAFEVSTT